MYRPLIAPRVLSIHPATNDAGQILTWLEVAVAGGGSATIDLLVEGNTEKVATSIERAAAGAVTAIVMPIEQRNDKTGRPWHVGCIGPASELALPPMANIGDDADEMYSAIVVPKIVRIYPGEEASDCLSERNAGRPLTCLDLDVGDPPCLLMHFAVGMRTYEVENLITAARAARKPLVFWHQRPLAINHVKTGHLITFGYIYRLGDRRAKNIA